MTFAILLCCGFGLTVYLSCMVVLLARIKRYGEWFLCACFGGRIGDLELEKVWTVLKWLQRLHAYLVSWSWGGVLVGLMIFFSCILLFEMDLCVLYILLFFSLALLVLGLLIFFQCTWVAPTSFARHLSLNIYLFVHIKENKDKDYFIPITLFLVECQELK